MALKFATGNLGKFYGARDILSELGIAIEMGDADIKELQLDDVVEIAADKAKQAYDKLGEPVFVMDASFYADALNGFPGTAVKGTLTTIGTKGILKLMIDESRRTYTTKNCIAYMDQHLQKPQTFSYAFGGSILDREIKATNPYQWSKMANITTVDTFPGKSWSEFTREESVQHEKNIGGLLKFGQWYLEHVRSIDMPIAAMRASVEDL